MGYFCITYHVLGWSLFLRDYKNEADHAQPPPELYIFSTRSQVKVGHPPDHTKTPSRSCHHCFFILPSTSTFFSLTLPHFYLSFSVPPSPPLLPISAFSSPPLLPPFPLPPSRPSLSSLTPSNIRVTTRRVTAGSLPSKTLHLRGGGG